MTSKFTLSFLFTCLVLSASFGQLIYEDDFEAYNNGDRLAAAANNEFWDTWSSMPGTSEDGIVSSTQAVSGSNALYISTASTDQLLRIADAPLTEGRYIIDFKMYLEANRYGYYNLLHFFNGQNSSWSTQSYFRPDGAANADAGGGDVIQWNQPVEEWFDVRYVVDLEDDFCTYYHKGEEMISWKWSSGTFGSSNELSIEAVNFYGWAENSGTAGYYIDDVRIEKVDKPGNVLTLSAELNDDNQVEIDWTAAGDTVDYILTNHGANIAVTNDTSALIAKPYPQEFNFRVGAHIDYLGYRFSDETSLNLDGGTDREFVLLETGTGTWCPNCPSAARGLDQMHDEGFNVGILEYHESGGDPFIVPAGSARVDYYNLTGFPTTYAGGAVAQVGGSFTGNDYSVFLSSYNNRMNRRSLYNFDMTLTEIGDRQYRVDVSGEELYEYFDGVLNLRLALTESKIPYSWQGLQKLDFVLRDMYPDAAGTAWDFHTGVESYSYTFDLPTDFVIENCELVAFLQDDASKEVLASEVINVADAMSSVDEVLSASVALVPNPVVDMVTIKGLNDGNARIYNDMGKQVHQFQLTSQSHQENISSLISGTYILEIETSEGLVSKQLIKL